MAYFFFRKEKKTGPIVIFVSTCQAQGIKVVYQLHVRANRSVHDNSFRQAKQHSLFFVHFSAFTARLRRENA